LRPAPPSFIAPDRLSRILRRAGLAQRRPRWHKMLRPSGSTLKLLSLVRRKGFEAIL
jgi:hypothetical protein